MRMKLVPTVSIGGFRLGFQFLSNFDLPNGHKISSTMRGFDSNTMNCGSNKNEIKIVTKQVSE